MSSVPGAQLQMSEISRLGPCHHQASSTEKETEKNQGGWGDSGREKTQFQGSVSSFSKDVNKKLKQRAMSWKTYS